MMLKWQESIHKKLNTRVYLGLFKEKKSCFFKKVVNYLICPQYIYLTKQLINLPFLILHSELMDFYFQNTSDVTQ